MYIYIYIYIVNKGPWTYLPISYYHIDYIVFPMSFIIDENNEFLYVLYGKQDKEGWIAKIDFHLLMNSLTVLNEEC